MSELDAVTQEEELLRLWRKLNQSQRWALIRLCQGIVDGLPEDRHETHLVSVTLEEEGGKNDRGL
jgi:hypothetical protein